MQIRLPDKITLVGENKTLLPTSDVKLQFEGDVLVPKIISAEAPLCCLIFKWVLTDSERRKEAVKVLGDHWERGYGDLEWRGIVPHRCMPWYFLVSDASTGRTEGFGVRVRPAAMCFWQYTGAEIILYMDIRSGGRGVVLDGRELKVCEIVFYESQAIGAYSASREFCKRMCSDGIFPKQNVYGFNNWYYSYGKSSEKEILEDTDRLMHYCNWDGARPYMVIDDGWQPNPCDGPWDRGNANFPDMKGLAEKISQKGAVPGLWYRPLLQEKPLDVPLPNEWRSKREQKYLDPSHPAVLEYIDDTIKRITQWGYRLIKHDFTTFDIFGKWEFECYDTMTGSAEWSFYDRGLTTAEVIIQLYTHIRNAAGDAVIIACNAIGHLCAGLAEINRTGDDTSGREWSRTRRMGINTLAFRMMQNSIFYMADADCAGITPDVPWNLNKKWLSMLACSGSPLFISWDSRCDSSQICEAVSTALRRNATGADSLEPIDWFDTICPSEWLLNGEKITVDWYEDTPIDLSVVG